MDNENGRPLSKAPLVAELCGWLTMTRQTGRSSPNLTQSSERKKSACRVEDALPARWWAKTAHLLRSRAGPINQIARRTAPCRMSCFGPSSDPLLAGSALNWSGIPAHYVGSHLISCATHMLPGTSKTSLGSVIIGEVTQQIVDFTKKNWSGR